MFKRKILTYNEFSIKMCFHKIKMCFFTKIKKYVRHIFNQHTF